MEPDRVAVAYQICPRVILNGLLGLKVETVSPATCINNVLVYIYVERMFKAILARGFDKKNIKW